MMMMRTVLVVRVHWQAPKTLQQRTEPPPTNQTQLTTTVHAIVAPSIRSRLVFTTSPDSDRLRDAIYPFSLQSTPLMEPRHAPTC